MTATVTATTIKTISATPYSIWLNLVAIVLLLALLILKEIVSEISSDGAQRLAGALNIALMPLLLSFAFIVVIRILKVVS